MKLWLSMIIKNEENKIKQCIGDIVDLFDDVVILDTWSTDNTLELLKEMGINYINYQTNHQDKHRLIEARNYSIEVNKCERVLILDWDEAISRQDILKIKSFDVKEEVSWFFIKWLDHRHEEVFEDYKMCLINKNKVRFLFSVHACPQVYIRDNDWKGLRMNGVTLHHFPEKKYYRDVYITQIEDGIKENPWCLRFYWFLWYTLFKNKKYQEAREKLYFLTKNIWFRFPVETLNAIMVLASIHQELKDSISAYHYISLWLDYYDQVKDDFEVKINFRLRQWFMDTQIKLLNEPNAQLVPYEFAY